MDTAAVQAQRMGHSLEDEVVRLLIHGVLHLMGHDHVHGGVQARNMKREEERLHNYVKQF
jgi:probable rRNA maturation factor